MQWRFLNTGQHFPGMNMALDEAIWQACEAGTSPPTLRVYGWQPPALSLGYGQSVSKEVNAAACQRYGIEIVRRPTGGRAVLHDDEVTYSVVMPITLQDGSRTLTEHYHLIGLALAEAFTRLGLDIRLARPQRSSKERQAPSPACFAALSRYELSVSGKKLVGSAQKRGQHALLQHGSIPLSLDRQRLFQCLRVPPEQIETLVQEAYATMIAVHEAATAPIAINDIHEALRLGFATTLAAPVVEGEVQPEEWQMARELYAAKYATAVWNDDGAAAWRQRQADIAR
ncbi:lipoate--protein ligase family protein [Candidatus Entotheonella palauensis]|uniref:Octanoyltransferase n=1 Tax=Candidatus Entotheonella gemina TaxID=1429439 RepID=W4M632_9BACT|nr:biotin/lipoate A/B protein ligase family protein [Candidatus Entotheonella palauensis]ETX05376.1 MAG: octanoyltransferase [Candidatus Entotheonella gemina]